MKIMFNNLITFKGFDKPYERQGFAKSYHTPTEADVVENAIKNYRKKIDVNYVYTSIGKMFEDNGNFDVAKSFYDKKYRFLVKNQRALSDISEAEKDIKRISDKITQDDKHIDLVG